MRGERMFEANYVCMYDLLSFIPSLDDPNEIGQAGHPRVHCRLTPGTTRLAWSPTVRSWTLDSYGFNAQDELELLALTAKPERAANDKRISDVFSEHFFETNFWHMWKTLFAFEPYHSAIELRRYLLRFMHLFPDMATQSKLHPHQVQPVRFDGAPAHQVADRPRCAIRAEHTSDRHRHRRTTPSGEFTARGITMVQDGKEKKVEVRPEDIVIATLGSMVANVTFGTNDSPPELITTPAHEGKWALWETLSRKSKVIFP